MLQQIMEIQSEAESGFLTEPLYYFYPQLDADYAMSLPLAERTEHLEKSLRTLYTLLEDTINEDVVFVYPTLDKLQGADHCRFVGCF